MLQGVIIWGTTRVGFSFERVLIGTYLSKPFDLAGSRAQKLIPFPIRKHKVFLANVHDLGVGNQDSPDALSSTEGRAPRAKTPTDNASAKLELAPVRSPHFDQHMAM